MTNGEARALAEKYLSGGVQPGSKEERDGMNVVATVLRRVAEQTYPPQNSDDAIAYTVCTLLSIVFLKGELKLGDRKFLRDIAIKAFVATSRTKRGEYERALYEATKHFRVSRKTAERALSVHKSRKH
jgi:hypothetical protein